MTTCFWLIRHGEPEEAARQRCYGRLDLGLSPHGREQVALAAEYLRRDPPTVIVASPLRRTSDSAAIVAAACGCFYETNPGLREIHFGDFEGLTYDEIAARYPETFREWMEKPTQVRFPNGENFAGMRTRVLEAFFEIARRRAGETIGIVSHGGVIRILIAWALQVPDDCLFRIAQDYAAINRIELADGVPSVKMMNLPVEIRSSCT
jgi:alpha-ribazole phosphatase